MGESKRLDLAVTQCGLAQSREKAQALIMAGDIYVNGLRRTKAGFQVKEDDLIEIKGDPNPYVSRGGLKLQKALDSFKIDPSGLICLDVGASTGGFTDCLLSRGAAKVYAVDVGSGQLDWKLRNKPSVVCLERTNFRYVTSDQIAEKIDFAGVDVSFISLRLMFPALFPLMEQGGQAVCLIKPQFEAGRSQVGKKGVVREADTHIQVIESVCLSAVENGFSAVNLDYSPIKGPQGNIEFLIQLAKADNPEDCCENKIKIVVEDAHADLNRGDVI